MPIYTGTLEVVLCVKVEGGALLISEAELAPYTPHLLTNLLAALTEHPENEYIMKGIVIFIIRLSIYIYISVVE